jgi:hypothetical protein
VDTEAAKTALRVERSVRQYLLPRGEQWDFYHGECRKAVLNNCLSDSFERLYRHTQMARYFESLGPQARRALTERVYHLAQAAEAEATGVHLPGIAACDALYGLLKDGAFRQAQIGTVGFQQARNDLSRGQQFFVTHAAMEDGSLSAKELSRACWLTLRSGCLANSMTASIRSSIENLLRQPLDAPDRLSRALDAASALRDGDCHLALLLLLLLLLWIETECQAHRSPDRRSVATVRQILKGVTRLPRQVKLSESLHEPRHLPHILGKVARFLV